MSVYWLPFTFQEQLQLIEKFKRVDLIIDEQRILEGIKAHLIMYGFLDSSKTSYLQNMIERYGWML